MNVITLILLVASALSLHAADPKAFGMPTARSVMEKTAVRTQKWESN